MARGVSEIYDDIKALSDSERRDLLRTLIAELDGPCDEGVEREWLEEAQRRYREFVDGSVKGVPGERVLERARLRLSR